jgi:hypothetical protein
MLHDLFEPTDKGARQSELRDPYRGSVRAAAPLSLINLMIAD